jgi:predicted oxidoreductase
MLSANRPEHLIKTYNTSAKHIINSVEQSLNNFGTDYLDVLLIHRPDPLMNPVEVAEAIALLKQQGKILSFGVSNFLPHQAKLLGAYTLIEFNQVEISILQLQSLHNGTLEHCLQHQIVPMAWAPLGGGLFADDSHPRFRSIVAVTAELSDKYGIGQNEILLAWLHTHPSGIQSVIGTTKLERLIKAKQAAGIRLERTDWFRLLEAAVGEEVA